MSSHLAGPDDAIDPADTSDRGAAYEAPRLIRIHVDPVKELLLQTPCNPQPGAAPGGGPLCQPPHCKPHQL